MGKKQVAVSLRKPPPADPDAFVSGGADLAHAPGCEHAAEGPTVVTRVGERREVTVYLPTALARELSVRCVELDRDVSSFVAEALVKTLSIEIAAPALPPPAALDPWSRARALVAELRARLPLGFGAA
ncbi:MAG TPA: hypothetical protein VK762_12755 [Polyangiaceae bacterium]|nr:hypothetical protein [Polyangiaceae bacterium]